MIALEVEQKRSGEAAAGPISAEVQSTFGPSFLISIKILRSSLEIATRKHQTFYWIRLWLKQVESHPMLLGFACMHTNFARNRSINTAELICFVNSTDAIVILPEIMHRTSKYLENSIKWPSNFPHFQSKSLWARVWCQTMYWCKMKLSKHVSVPGWLENSLVYTQTSSLSYEKAYKGN